MDEARGNIATNIPLVQQALKNKDLSADDRRTYEEYIDEVEKLKDLDEAVKNAISALKTELKMTTTKDAAVRTEVSMPYLEKQKAIADGLMKASSFPFTVQYSEWEESYEIDIATKDNTIIIAEKEYMFTHPSVKILSFGMSVNDVTVKTNASNITISKKDFIDTYLPILLEKSTNDETHIWDRWVRVSTKGILSPKSISTPKQAVDKWMLNKLTWLKVELEKRMKEWLTPVELAEGLKYLSDHISDAPTKQIAINFFLNKFSESYTLYFEKDGKFNVVPKDTKNTALAATYQNALQSSLTAGHISIKNIQESMTMLTGQRWSDYARTIAESSQANPSGYAKYLADSYGLDIDKKPISQIQAHKSMTPTDKAWLLSYLNGQMSTLDIDRVTTEYKENLKSYNSLIDSPFFAVLNKATGGAKLTPEQTRKAAEAAARGSSESTGDGKTATWALGILGAIVGLGFKKWEWWSLWTSLKRIFMGGLAIGWVMLGCAAGREWKKELGMDLCEEAKKSMKDAFKEIKDGIKWDGTWGGDAEKPKDDGKKEKKDDERKTEITTTQEAAKKKVEGMDDLKKKIVEIKDTQANAPIEKYIDFARSLESQKLSVLVSPSNPEHSIFSAKDWFDPSITNIPSNLDAWLLKRVLRWYLVGVDIKFGDLKQNNATWDDYKSKYDIDKTLWEALRITYGTVNQQVQSNSAIDENSLKQFTFTWVNVDASKTQVSKNWSDFTGKYTINSIPNKTLDPSTQEIEIQYDSQGNLKTTNIKITAKAPIGNGRSEITYTLAKNWNTITFA